MPHTFFYPRGHERFTTCTAGELAAYLAQLPPAMPVLATWEHTLNPIKLAEIELTHEAESKSKTVACCVLTAE